MAISTDDLILKFGTLDAVDDGSTSAITDGAVSAQADITAWTNDDDVENAALILRWQYTTGTIDGDIFIIARPINIDGTDDAPQPDSTYKGIRLGRFEIDPSQATSTDTVYMSFISLLPVTMKSSQEIEFYLWNETGVTIAANWDLDIVPITSGPKA